MKRGKIIVIILIATIFLSLTFISALDDNSSIKIDKAYQCLEGKVKDKCSTLTLEEQIFSLLSLQSNSGIKDECSAALLANSNNNGECWPKSNCNVKQTSQAILALSQAGKDTSKAEKWIFSQNATPEDLSWYLEIEAPNGAASCKISYSGKDYITKINDDKTLSSGAGSCLDLAAGNYWLKVAPNCYSKEFTVSCSDGFLTTLLYQKKGADTIYVSSQVNQGSSNGTTTEKIETQCFGQGTKCNYEGTLWATFVLNKDHDMNNYIPYLTAFAPDNKQYFPDTFLYFVTNFDDYLTSILSKQKFNKYWEESNEKLYDTPLALLVLQNNNAEPITNAKNYLLSIQDSNGCWANNVRNTGFILYSAFPRTSSTTEPGTSEAVLCEDSNGYCMSSVACDDAGGIDLGDLACSSVTQVCCSKAPKQETCSEKGGTVCKTNEACSIGTTTSSDEAECCLGACQTPTTTEKSECEDNGGACDTVCSATEESKSFACTNAADLCCVKKSTTEGPKGSKVWIWILAILILYFVTLNSF